MMNAAIGLNSHEAYRPRSEPQMSGGLGLPPTQSKAISDALAEERLVERFANLTWKTLAPIMTLSLTFVIGVLACAQFLVLRS